MTTLDVVTCGELLIDFVALEAGVSLADARTFEKAAGGAPANVAVGLARLGRSVGFLGQVGDDDFGQFLTDTLRGEGIDVTGLCHTRVARTALAFVSLMADGERDFMFYRHPSADMLWEASEQDHAVAATGRVFHFGSISLISEPSRSSTISAIAAAREAGSLISYDPNLRLPLWPSADAAREGMVLGLGYANIAKMSREELAFVSGINDVVEGSRRIWHEELRLMTITCGVDGCWWITASDAGQAPSFPVTSVDTTGAGDAFVAGALAGLIETDFTLDSETLRHVIRLANAAGALAVTRRGAIPSLPTRTEIDQFIAAHSI